MPNKEERIFAFKLDGQNCDIEGYCVPFNCSDFQNRPIPNCRNCNQGMTRADAVKVMKPAVKAALNKAMAWSRSWEDTAQGAAEAALDALIGGKNGHSLE